MKVHVDFETRSPEDISKCGAHKYVQHEEFKILLCAISVNDGPVDVLDLTVEEELKRFNQLFGNIMDGYLYREDVGFVAYNAMFEAACLARHFGLTIDEAYMSKFRCTMVHAAYLSYPQGLEATGKALGVRQDKAKLRSGRALINLFSVPQKPTKKNGGRKWTRPQDEPEKWETYKEYNKRDVESEMEIASWLDNFPMPESEWDLWRQECVMNANGVRCDREMMEGARYCIAEAEAELDEEARRLTGLDNPNSPTQMLDWLNLKGHPLPNLQKATVSEALAGALPDDVRRALEIRQQTGKTSVKKYDAMHEVICDDDRMRGLTRFYGAGRTGRWAGSLVQLQNLTKHHIGTVDEARKLVREGNYDAIKMLYGNVHDLLSQLVRTAIIPSEGRKLIVADFSAIEARVIAWLAREAWVMEAFAAGKDIYCETASMMYHVPVEKGGVNGELRQKGKVATLACIAEGELVLTDRGLVPIEDVQNFMKLWDGTDWVAHSGVLFKGTKEVIEYDGLRATEDHIVWAEIDGEYRQVPFGQAAARGSRLVQSGAGREAIRLAENNFARETIHESMVAVHGGDRVCRVRETGVDTSCEYDAGQDAGVPELQSAEASTEMAGQTVHSCKTTVREPRRPAVQELRGSGDQVRVPECSGSVSLHDRSERSAGEQETGNRQDKQQRELRSRKSAVGDEKRTESQPASVEKVSVFDILNAGPNNRFTVSNVLVHNCGYQGGVNALKVMDPSGTIPESEMEEIVDRWRNANKMITSLWYELEYAMQDVVLTGIPKRVAKDRIEIALESDNWQRFMTMRLPSGRKLFYALPTLQENRFGKQAVHYWGLNGVTKKWEEMSTYGGRATENCVQSIARDCLAESLRRLRQKGLVPVFHVHDEVVIDAPMDVTVDEVCDLMSEPIPWAKGLVLKAAGFEGDYYKKD